MYSLENVINANKLFKQFTGLYIMLVDPNDYILPDSNLQYVLKIRGLSVLHAGKNKVHCTTGNTLEQDILDGKKRIVVKNYK